MPAYKLMPMILQRLAWGPVRVILTLFAGLTVKGLEHLERIEGNFIIASNHTIQLDPILIVACLPFFSRHIPLMFASREKDFYAQRGWRRLMYGGVFFKLLGAHPMYGGLRDYERALRHHLAFARKGENVCIFPTGKKESGITPSAKGGVAYLMHTANMPIIPVKIEGLEHMTWLSMWRGEHRVSVVFGAPLFPNELFANARFLELTRERNPYAEAAQKIMNVVEELR